MEPVLYMWETCETLTDAEDLTLTPFLQKSKK